ncbi:MarR family winged helix-turn-helix transcriptional regulator [Acidisoma silvae]|uniref:MarR family transcriptional regulator n=1 Tax=Acidisoma silvae TaxID=2802396 RepID=A0A964E0I3_9PROT|nr:MarR family transcriptional regulator [Acidisoma silvae]MCB8877381.1 MarR family transcriptional regulator [Acidisoma silvae]
MAVLKVSKAKHHAPSQGDGTSVSSKAGTGPVISADRYVPGLLRAVANKLEGGTSRFLRMHYGIGLSEWYMLAALAAAPGISSPEIAKAAGLDKAAISRGLTRMEEQKLVASRNGSGRSRVTSLTVKGRRLYDRIAEVALVREEQLLSQFSVKDVDSLISLLTALARSTASLKDTVPKLPSRKKVT